MIRSALFLLPLLFAAAAPAQRPADEAMTLVNAERYAEARELINEALDAGSTSNELLYQLARLEALTGEAETAEKTLIAAIAAGYTDFYRLDRDPALRSIHGRGVFRTIVSSRESLLEERARADFEAVQRAFPERYAFARVPGLRLQFACAHGEDVLAEVIAEATILREWVHAELWEAPDDPELDPWVTVILPSPEDFVRLVGPGALGGSVGGFYDPEVRRLVTSDLGPSLRHELMHVFHFRRLERLGQRRPHWFTEGLAALVEDLDPLAETIEPVGSWRTDIARRRLAAGRLRPWRDLFAQDRDRFVGHRPKAQYAQSRAIAMFFHAEGTLADVIAAFDRTHGDDPDGLAAIRLASGEEIDRVERRFRGWLATSLKSGEPDAREGTRRLGLILTAGRGDGPAIDFVELRSPASAARLRMRDVIRTVDGRPVRTVTEFLRAAAAGGIVEVGVRRGRAERTLTLDARGLLD